MGNSWHQEWWGAEQKPGKHHSFPSAIGLPSVSSTALGWAAVRLWQVLGEEKSVVEIILPQPDSKVEPANFLQASLQDWGSSSRDVSWDLLKASGRMFFGSLIQVFLSDRHTSDEGQSTADKEYPQVGHNSANQSNLQICVFSRSQAQLQYT